MSLMPIKQDVDSDDVLKMVEHIGSTSSKNEKISIVESYSNHEIFRRSLVYALNPLIAFNIRPATWEATGSHTDVFDSCTWALLDDLAARKITGDAAREALDKEFGRLTPASAEMLWRIVRKDLRAGCSDSTVNKAISGLIPEFPYMRCCLPKDTNLNTFSWVEGVFSQEKADGMFSDVKYYTNGTVRISSRNGTDFPTDQFSNVVTAIQTDLTPGNSYQGEMLVEKSGVVLDREIGNGILNSVQQGGTLEADERIVFVVWDEVPIEHVVPKGKYNAPYKTRFGSLKQQLEGSSQTDVKLIPTRIVHSLAEAYVHYGEMLALGKEGTIIKDGNALWRDGTSKQQVKLKIVAECDLKIVGFTEGNGKNKATFGSITCQTEDGLLEVNVSGFKDKPAKGILTRSQINEIRDELIDTIMAVSFNDIMYATKAGDKHSLFLPRHLEFRRDKTVADSFKRVEEQLEAAREAYING